MDLIGTPQEHAEGNSGVMTRGGRKVLVKGLGKEWAGGLTFWGPTIDEKKAQEIVDFEKNHNPERAAELKLAQAQ